MLIFRLPHAAAALCMRLVCGARYIGLPQVMVKYVVVSY